MKFHLYRDRKGEWRWRLTNKGRIMADSGEGYTRRIGAARAVASIQRRCGLAPVEIQLPRS